MPFKPMHDGFVYVRWIVWQCYYSYGNFNNFTGYKAGLSCELLTKRSTSLKHTMPREPVLKIIILPKLVQHYT